MREHGDDVFVYEAATGEINDVEASFSGGVVGLVDAGATIRAGRGCTSVGVHEVTCTLENNELVALLGNQSDTARLRGRWWVSFGGGGADDLLVVCSRRCGGAAFGGSGDDVLKGASALYGGLGDDTLNGTPARDWFYGMGGDDTLNALGGNDSLFPGLGDDAVNGGRGGDTVFFFASAPIGVAADLRTGIVTGGQGNDTLTGVECLNGSEHDDHFIGDAHANCFGGLEGDDVIKGRGGADDISGGCCFGRDRLFGGSGPDRITGGRGKDFLHGGIGRDRLRGEQGDDRFEAKDGLRDRIWGGGGFDQARADVPRDVLSGIEEVGGR